MGRLTPWFSGGPSAQREDRPLKPVVGVQPDHVGLLFHLLRGSRFKAATGGT